MNNRRHGFLISAGNPVTIDPPASVGTQADKLNDQDEIVGDYSDSQGVDHGFLAEGPELVDPVPDLMSGPAVASASLASVGAGGRVVKGAAADGVTEVVVRIPAQNVGDQFKLTLINDQNVQSNPANPNWDGALGNPGDTTFSLNQVTVSAIGVTTQGGETAPLAFAVYRAPIDFARQNSDGSYMSGYCSFINAASGFGVPSNTPEELLGFQPKSDDQAACRTVSISVQNLRTGTSSSLPVIILRPPVVLVHGLWDDKGAWNNFSPLITDPPLTVDSRFYVGRVSYDNLVGPSIVSSDPSYSGIVFAAEGSVQLKAKANSLGFAFNAPNVLAQTDRWIGNFKQGNNPMGIPAAAVQVDMVAHSMGGDIARTMVLLPSFLSDETFGQGSIHKLITIDTPHLGSPLASLLLSSQEDGGCLEHLLALKGKFVFNTAFLANAGLVSGAMSDLQPSSPALRNIANQNRHPLPTALIAGIYTFFQSLDVIGGNAFLIRLVCSTTDPLADDLTSSNYPLVFSGLANDAIVSEPSQLNGNSAVNGAGVFEFTGVVHSVGTEKLGFAGPSVLDASAGVATTVILLLNTPINAPGQFNPITP